MTTKSSRKPVSNRSQKHARVPNKWRNLPAYGHGITPTFKARPVIPSQPFEESDSVIEDFNHLMPVSMEAFMAEHAAMLVLGYHALGTSDGQRPCRNCGSETSTLLEYTKRYRNGKPNYDWMREFFLCPQCLHVGEIIVVERAIEKAAHSGPNTRDFDSDVA